MNEEFTVCLDDKSKVWRVQISCGASNGNRINTKRILKPNKKALKGNNRQIYGCDRFSRPHFLCRECLMCWTDLRYFTQSVCTRAHRKRFERVRSKKNVEGEQTSRLRAAFKTRKMRAVNKGLVYCFIIRSVGTLIIALPKQAEGSWTGLFTWRGVSAATSESIIFLLQVDFLYSALVSKYFS